MRLILEKNIIINGEINGLNVLLYIYMYGLEVKIQEIEIRSTAYPGSMEKQFKYNDLYEREEIKCSVFIATFVKSIGKNKNKTVYIKYFHIKRRSIKNIINYLINKKQKTFLFFVHICMVRIHLTSFLSITANNRMVRVQSTH